MMRKVALGLALLAWLAGCGNGAEDGSSPDVAQPPADVAQPPADVAQPPADVSDSEPADGLYADVAQPPADVSDSEPEDVAQPPADIVAPPDLEVTLLGPDSWQRGPVVFPWDVDFGAYPLSCVVRFEFSADGAPFKPAAALTGYGDALAADGAGPFRFVWDSMADLQKDSPMVVVRMTVSREGEDVGSAVTDPFPLRNDPAMDRTLLITSSINGNDKVRPLRFSSVGGLSFDGTLFTVGEAPGKAVFSPNGKAAVVLCQGTKTLEWFTVTEDGVVAPALVLSVPDHNFEGALFDRDGASVLLVDLNSTATAGIHRLEVDPWTGLPEPATVPLFLSKHHVAQAAALLPDNEGYVVVSGKAVGEMYAQLQALTPEGDIVDTLTVGPEGSFARDVAVSPQGDTVALTYYNLFGEGDRVVTFLRHDDGTLEEVGSVAANDPDSVAFVSDGLSFVVSEAYGNKVRLLGIGGGIALSELASVKLGFAETIATPAWGPDVDTFFVTSVSASTGESGVGRVSVSGSSLVLEEVLSLGGGNDVIPDGLGIQP
jgi:DNA-binding beta-propeller fold protein YncE